MTPTVKLIIGSATYPLAHAAPTKVPADAMATITVDGVPAGGVVNVFNFTGPKVGVIASGLPSPYQVSVQIPATGARVIGVEVWGKRKLLALKRQQIGETGKFTIVATPAGKPDHAADPVQSEQPHDDAATDAPAPSHLVKGIVTDLLLPADTPIVRLDGSIVTMRQMLAVWGTKAARLWYSYEPDKPPDAGRIAKKIQWCRDNGIAKLILCVTPKQGLDVKPTADQVTAFFAALVPLITGKSVDVDVELANEPNQPTFWRWSLASLVSLFVAPACAVLHKAGIDTIGASPTGDVNAVRELRAGGMACRAQGFHPYRRAGSLLKSMMLDLLGVTNNQPVDLTEFNAYVGKDVAAGTMTAADAVASQTAQWAVLQACPTVRCVCYYAMIVTGPPTSTSPLALLRQDADGTVHETVYSRDFWAVVT